MPDLFSAFSLRFQIQHLPSLRHCRLWGWGRASLMFTILMGLLLAQVPLSLTPVSAVSNLSIAWGNNEQGQLGDGYSNPVKVPTKVSLPTGVTSFSSFSAGNGFNLAKGSDNALYAWGDNNFGALGQGTFTTGSAVPLKVSLPSGVTSFSAFASSTSSETFSLAKGSDGSLYAWGENDFGGLGNGTSGTNSAVLVKVSLPSGVTSFSAFSAGGDFALALGSDGALYAWGDNEQGELGDNGPLTQSAVPVKVTLPSGVTSFSAFSTGSNLALAKGSDGALYAWGSNEGGELGNGSASFTSPTPVKVSLPTGVTSFSTFAAGRPFGLAKASDGKLYAWGDNQFGELGIGTNNNTSNVPVRVNLPAGVTSFSTFSAGDYYSLALGSDGALYAWGTNLNGNLGNGTTNESDSPVKVSLPGGVTGFSAFSAASSSGLAKGSDGNLYAWGDNSNGEIGNGLTGHPVTIENITLPSGVSDYTALSGGSEFSLGLGSNNQLYAWGDNQFDELGNGTSGGFNGIPGRVSLPSGVTSFNTFSAGDDFALAKGSDGVLYAWGNNHYDELGHGSANSDVPVKVNLPTGVTSFSAFSAGTATSLAKGSDGKLYAWGDNSAGEFGNGTNNTTSNVPVQVNLPTGVTSFSSFSARFFYNLALGSDGALYAWGSNLYGNLGNGTNNESDVPFKVTFPTGVTSFSTFSAGGSFSLAKGSDGSLYAWGDNFYGQLGNGTSGGNAKTPGKVNLPTGVTSFSTFSTGFDFSVAKGNDGNLYAWGDSGDNQVGNVNNPGLTPAKVNLPSGTQVVTFASGGKHTLAQLQLTGSCGLPNTVTTITDDGSACSLRVVVNGAVSGSTVSFNLPSGQDTITLHTTGLTVPAGITLQGSCGVTGPTVIITGGNLSGPGLTLGGNDTVAGLKITNFNGQLILIPFNHDDNYMTCIIAKK